MKQNQTDLAEQYLKALAENLKLGPQANLNPALKLGRQAAALRLKTLDLAWIHEQALAALRLSNIKNVFTKQAGIFFMKANIPIEREHRRVQHGKTHLRQSKRSLDQSVKELAISKNQPQRNDLQNKNKEKFIKKNGKCHEKCLKESLELQECLRQLTHRVLAAQEDERKQISLELHNEIAQTLLGINVRLHSLKHQDRSNTNGLMDDITNARRLVVESAKRVRKFARELAVTAKVPTFGSLHSKWHGDNSSLVRTSVK